MASKWPKVKIDEIKAPRDGAIAIGPFGSRMKAEVYVESGTPVIRGNNLTGKTFMGDFVFVADSFADGLANCIVGRGDLVFPHRGAIGEVGIVTDDRRYIISTSLMKLSLDYRKADPDYVYQFFKSDVGRHELLKNASTVGTPGIGTPLTSLRNIEIPLPPLPIQRQIAAILSAFDDKIELNRQMNRTLEQMARALFKSWFVDFDPVRAKMRGEMPEGMDAETAALFPDRMEEVEGREVPRGWRVGTLGDLVQFNPSLRLSKDENATYLDMGNMPTVGMSAEGWATRPFNSGSRFQNGDTLLARITPCLENGKAAYVDFLDKKEVGWGSTEYLGMRPKLGIPSILPYLLCRDKTFRGFAISNMNGSSGRQRVSFQSLANYPVFVPDSSVWLAFEGMTLSVIQQARIARDESARLAQLRDALLPRLLSGEVDVSGWESEPT